MGTASDGLVFDASASFLLSSGLVVVAVAAAVVEPTQRLLHCRATAPCALELRCAASACTVASDGLGLRLMSTYGPDEA